MSMESDTPSVQCLVTCDNMSTLRGDHCYLPMAKARMLEYSGSVKITKLSESVRKELKDSDYLYRGSFSKRVTTRIAWVQNYKKNGGAEISNFTLVNLGAKLGFDTIGFILGDNNFSYPLLKKADLIIVNNLHSSGKQEFVEWLFESGKPYVKYDHDFSETEYNLFKKAKMNVFISPKHQKYYEEKCASQLKAVCLPLAIDVDSWPKFDGKRIKDSVFIPSYGKCRDASIEFIKKNPDYNYYVAGDIKPIGKNVRAVGDVSYKDMPAQYQKYETVFHQPTNPGAGERVLFEGILSGCKIICNDKCGHTSWDFDWKDDRVLRPILKRATYKFWHEVGKVINAA